MQKPIIRSTQETDGRWLAWCEDPCVISYGFSQESARQKTLQTVTDVIKDNDPDFAFTIPSEEEAEFFGEEFLKIVSRWTGIPVETFLEENEEKPN